MVSILGTSSFLFCVLIGRELTYHELGKAIFAFLVATLSYFAETGINPDFESIPDAMWWSFITISTIGYGDVVPMTHMGKCKYVFDIGGRILDFI